MRTWVVGTNEDKNVIFKKDHKTILILLAHAVQAMEHAPLIPAFK